MLHVFAATIKPLLFYGSEIWEHQSKNERKLERVKIMFAKYILEVHRKSTNAAVLGDIGLRMLKIDMQINAFKCYDYLEQHENSLIKDAFIEKRTHHTSWYSNVTNLIKVLNLTKVSCIIKTCAMIK